MEVKAKVKSVLYNVSLSLTLIGIVIYISGATIPPWMGEGMAVDGLTLIVIGVIFFVIKICFNYFSQNG